MALLTVFVIAAMKIWGKWSSSNYTAFVEVPLHAVSTAGIPEMKFAMFDDPGFQARTIASFPDKAVASPDEARVLWEKGGYNILDIRSKHEQEDRGVIRAGKGTVNIPLFFAEYKFDPTVNKKVVKPEVNPKWLEQVKETFPSKDTKILVMCSDGRRRSPQALDLLDGEGYTHLVGMKGGFNKWNEVFNFELDRRDPGDPVEVDYRVDSEGCCIAGCGIHATGAQFAMMDSMKQDQPPLHDMVPWADWSETVQQLEIAAFSSTTTAQSR